jgi:hypothetical protein
MQISALILWTVMLFGTFAGLSAQQENSSSITVPPIPTVTFTLDFPVSAPEHYSLRVAQDGKASYESMGKLTPEADGDPFTYSFAMSEENRARIFELAERAKFFEGDVDYKKGRLANTGKKVLGYADGKIQHETAYNFSTNPAIQQLTKIFQNTSATLEAARRLQYFHRYQRLAVEEELKRMEEMAKSDSLDELQAIAPILQEIAEDKAILNVTRSRAVRLLGK